MTMACFVWSVLAAVADNVAIVVEADMEYLHYKKQEQLGACQNEYKNNSAMKNYEKFSNGVLRCTFQ